MSYAIDFAPHVPMWLLWGLAGLAALVTLYAFVQRARGAWARVLAFGVVLLALANPLIVHETREPLSDVMALVIDRSQSMDINTRRADADRAAVEIRKALKQEKNLDVREAEIVTRTTGDDSGTEAFAAINSVLADVPPERVAGAILITDGEVHDAPAPKKVTLHGPLQALIVGHRNQRDRKLTVISAARYAIVGQPAIITVRVDDFGSEAKGSATVHLRVDGADKGVRQVALGRETPIPVLISHGGENVVEIEAAPGPAELTLENNRAVATISGVRDRLRVMLVSGEPHAGERVWRNLLKADPSVDLVHFTILRPPDKQDATPIDELSLIAFPTRQLFDEKLASFDLVIFDRYSERGILPLAYYENLASYVEGGGALLVSAGPEYAQEMSIYRTPLAAVLPAQPTGDVVQQGFKPMVTQAIRPSRNARSARRQRRQQAAELGALVPIDWRREGFGRDRDERARRQATTCARSYRQGARGGVAFRSALAVGARVRRRRATGRIVAAAGTLADERAGAGGRTAFGNHH